MYRTIQYEVFTIFLLSLVQLPCPMSTSASFIKYQDSYERSEKLLYKVYHQPSFAEVTNVQYSKFFPFGFNLMIVETRRTLRRMVQITSQKQPREPRITPHSSAAVSLQVTHPYPKALSAASVYSCRTATTAAVIWAARLCAPSEARRALGAAEIGWGAASS